MNIKTFGMTIAAGAIAACGLSPAALAVNFTNHSGTICQEYDVGQANTMDRFAYATRTSRVGSTYVVCPLTRDTTNGNGAYAYVDVYHTAAATTSCTLYSYSYTGTLLASNSLSWTGTGFHEFYLNAIGAGKSNTYSDYAVLCYIPGSYVGQVRGVDLGEQ